MLPQHLADLTTLKIGSSETIVKVLSGPYVKFTDFGFIPVLHVEVKKSGLDYLLPISAKSLAKPLYEIYQKAERLDGLELGLKKDGEEKTSKYLINPR